jgi:hypothetical protein
MAENENYPTSLSIILLHQTVRTFVHGLGTDTRPQTDMTSIKGVLLYYVKNS